MRDEFAWTPPRVGADGPRRRHRGANFGHLATQTDMNDDPSTILLVEDDGATRTFLADNLSADGYDLLVADCASIGLSLLERKFPDLALVDVGLPDGSGLELLRRVRSADGIASRVNPDMPLMVISGRATELDRVRGFDRGADDYVCKPFSYP